MILQCFAFGVLILSVCKGPSCIRPQGSGALVEASRCIKGSIRESQRILVAMVALLGKRHFTIISECHLTHPATPSSA